MAAICPGATPVIPMRFWSPNSCSSKLRSPRFFLIIVDGSADFLISPQFRALRKTTSSTPGRDSGITPARETFVPPPGLCGIGTAGSCLVTSPRFANCRALAAISRTQSQPLLSINRYQLSKRIARVFWPDCSTCAPRSILQSAAKSSGRMPRNLSRRAMQPVSIPRLSIWVLLFARWINRNAASARSRNSAAQKIPERCPSRNPSPAQSDLSKDTHLSFVTAGFCLSNHPYAGVECGFCRRSNLTA